MHNQLEPIPEKEFLQHWESNKPTVLPEKIDILKYFKLHINLLAKTTLGPYYWQIYSIDNPKILFAEGDIEVLTPYTQQNLLKMPPAQIFQLFHPSELNKVYGFIQKLTSTIMQNPVSQRDNITGTIYCRVKNKFGYFSWNSVQYPAFYFNKKAEAVFGLVVYTDISHIIKEDMQPMLTIFNSLNRKMEVFNCQQNGDSVNKFEVQLPMTIRQQEIFSLLLLGKASKQIASYLNISKSTVDNHRQALLKKFNVSSTVELVSKVSKLIQ